MMNRTSDSIRVVIPLSIRRRNGRPKILPPEHVEEERCRTQEPHILKALGRAWSWRRRLESGEVATAGELARLENFTDRFVNRILRLAYLSPDVLERLAVYRNLSSLSLKTLIEMKQVPWTTQIERVFSRE